MVTPIYRNSASVLLSCLAIALSRIEPLKCQSYDFESMAGRVPSERVVIVIEDFCRKLKTRFHLTKVLVKHKIYRSDEQCCSWRFYSLMPHFLSWWISTWEVRSPGTGLFVLTDLQQGKFEKQDHRQHIAHVDRKKIRLCSKGGAPCLSLLYIYNLKHFKSPITHNI